MALEKNRKKEIAQCARETLEKYGFDERQDTYVDAVRIAKFLGFKVGESRNLKPNEDGFIIMYEDIKAIGVNILRSVEDKRFTTAHELGHYVLHQEKLRENMMMREHIDEKVGDTDEDEADFFAACILMPELSFRREWERLSKEKYTYTHIISILRSIFRVPEESIKRRIEEITAN